MDRRDVLKALLTLPAVKSIAVADVKPNDVIVLEHEGFLSDLQKTRIHRQLLTVWPDRKIVILDGQARLRIARESA